MATKHNDVCLERAADDEPIFVVRAQDWTAPIVVVVWIALQFIADIVTGQNHCPTGKLMEAMQCAINMRNWPHRKIAD